MRKSSTVCAGIDTGKHKLDVAIDGSAARTQVSNDADGHKKLSAWLRERRVKRIGIEASGGYEQHVVTRLRRDGFVVIVFQPARVRAYGLFHGQLAKNDRIDAALIAACTAATKKIHAPPDPRLQQFTQPLTLIEQITDDIARFKTRRETCRDERLRRHWDEEIARLEALKERELEALIAAIRKHRDLAKRLDLIASVDGVGPRTAVAILVRLPEIGRLTREQIAALAGLAPYDDDSGEQKGVRHIRWGRKRLRGSLYAAALPAAMRWNSLLMAFYDRLIATGKEHKVALVACTRKLLVFVNAVVARGKPWLKTLPELPSEAALRP
jgi:transposase